MRRWLVEMTQLTKPFAIRPTPEMMYGKTLAHARVRFTHVRKSCASRARRCCVADCGAVAGLNARH